MKSRLTAIVLSIAMLIPSLSYAQNKLTYEDAFKKAVQNNLQLEKVQKNLDKVDETLTTGTNKDGQMQNFDKSGQSSGQDMENVITSINSSLQYQNLIDDEKALKMSYDAQRDAIGVGLKNIFLKIEYLEKNENLIQEKIANMRKNISINTIKYKYGMISKLDFENSQLELDKLKNSQKENTLQLESAYKDLSNIVGSKVDQKVEYIKIEYKTLSSLGISKESAIGTAISQAPTIFRQNANIRALEERIKYDLLDKSQTSLPREETSTSVGIQDVNLRINKQSIENAVIETANSIENLELNIKNIDDQIENLQRQSKNMAQLVKLGMKTSIELENLNLKIEDLQMQRRNLLNNHDISLERYTKPYLLSLTGE
ncbi:TolC family protein [Peptoanaerobacter stomatis]|uniref:TolC family protein n=1 Tax=Peptoanaerobacter stomatis TaxID=796937 RepID=UPI003FA122BD